MRIRNRLKIPYKIPCYIWPCRKYFIIGILTLGISYLFSTDYINAQTPPDPVGTPFETGELVIGVRTVAYDVAHYENERSVGGFCGEFGRRLGEHLNLSVRYIQIDNVYNERQYKRFDGLRENYIHVECGPNSRPIGSPSYAQEILFSKAEFHTTGIRLLLKKEKRDQLMSKDIDLSSLKISVLKQTATEEILRDNEELLQSIADPLPESRIELINSLLAGEYDAYASDTLILDTLYSRNFDINECQEGSGTCNKKSFAPLVLQGFVIYPQESYITGETPTDKYVIAIWEKLYEEGSELSNKLKDGIEEVLTNGSLNKAIKELEQAEKLSIESVAPSFILRAWEFIKTNALKFIVVILSLIIALLSIPFVLASNSSKTRSNPMMSNEERNTLSELEAILTEIKRDIDNKPKQTQRALGLSAGIELFRNDPRVRRSLKILSAAGSAALERINDPVTSAIIAGLRAAAESEEPDVDNREE
jgi:hypothetical protein